MNFERNPALSRPTKKVLPKTPIVFSIRLSAFAHSRFSRRVFELILHLCNSFWSKFRKGQFTLLSPSPDDLHCSYLSSRQTPHHGRHASFGRERLDYSHLPPLCLQCAAKCPLEPWREGYNQTRPHRVLGYRLPHLRLFCRVMVQQG